MRGLAMDCVGKQVFRTKKLADQVAARMRASRTSALSPYKCQHCGEWHIGSHVGRRWPFRREERRKDEELEP